MIPVFSLVLDKDVDENLALLYPELYKELTLGKTLSYKTFLVWVMVSIYQGMSVQKTEIERRLCNHDFKQCPSGHSHRKSPHLSIFHSPCLKRARHDRSRNQYLA